MDLIRRPIDNAVRGTYRYQSYKVVVGDVLVTDTTISFTTPDTIGDSNSGLGIFVSGDIIDVSGTASNNGEYTVDTASASTLTTIEQTISTEGLGPSFTITKLRKDVRFDFDSDLGRPARTGYITNQTATDIDMFFNHAEDPFGSMKASKLLATETFYFNPKELSVSTLKLISTASIGVDIFVS